MKALRRLPEGEKKVLYLTFDDGPHPESTAAVLETLARHGALATFFVIGQKACQEPAVFGQIRAAGHAIGNHSLDHGYSRFFLGRRALRDWIARSEAQLTELQGSPTVGFRPPAGVRTPELHRALRELGLPLVLWSTRFFDTRFRWTETRALRSLACARSGDIILLHDRQSMKRLPGFIRTLDAYLAAGRKAGFEFRALTR